MTAIPDLLGPTPYAGYTYGYPHKTAYRPLADPVALDRVWAGEDRHALFGYAHVPFCEMRCGFCNLFTTANPRADLVADYLAALTRQSRVIGDLVPGRRFARFAIGGGTPTYLTAAQLAALLDLLADIGMDATSVPASVETSPHTATKDRLGLLADRGIERISIGVQSMIEAEVHGVGRRQRHHDVATALDTIRSVGPSRLNVDLMYGLTGQTVASWRHTLDRILDWDPDEVFCYPLYVRPLTGIGRLGRDWDDQRLALYRAGRDALLAAGYRQTSMRRFCRPADPAIADADDRGRAHYCCQADGMLGLGAGARSYTRALHYSEDYAVGRPQIGKILADFVTRRPEDWRRARYGIALDQDEQRRRWVLLSLLQVEGLDLAEYRRRFGTDPLTDLGLAPLIDLGLAGVDHSGGCASTGVETGTVRLTPLGLEWSDAIGPWLYSPRVRALSRDHEWR